jgi:hypothetical protein
LAKSLEDRDYVKVSRERKRLGERAQKDKKLAAAMRELEEARDISKDLTLSHSKCVNRQRPSGKTNWQSEMAARFGLGSTLRPRGRPRIDKKSSPSPLCMISRCEIRGVRGLGNSSGQTREQLLHVTNSRPGLGQLLHD